MTLPVHYAVGRAQYWFSLLSIGAAFGLLAVVLARLALDLDSLGVSHAVAFVAGICVADFGSGLVHWGADTWGRDDLPVIGHRLLVPFRIHHVNPDDLLRRSFVDANGDVAFLAVPALLGLLVVPLETMWHGALACGGVGLCSVGMMTNQIHQWAHMPSPPRLIRLLQDCRLILGRSAHATHHSRPYDAHYCITTGWCNAPLDALGFFRRLERIVTQLTGVRPRHDDERYAAQHGSELTA